MVELDLEMRQLRSAAERTAAEGLIRGLESDAQRERLERQLNRVSIDQVQRVFAPRDGKVLRIGIATGAVVVAGQSLLALAADDGQWEAWLYVSAREAGLLQSGQEIELKLDAYPHQIFGTVSAVVVSVTRLAVLPNEVRVPITIAGAVFEVRAKLNGVVGEALSTDTLPGIGASVTADIVRQRYRLYQWLLRSRSPLAGLEHV
jgi:membrane fusion protein